MFRADIRKYDALRKSGFNNPALFVVTDHKKREISKCHKNKFLAL